MEKNEIDFENNQLIDEIENIKKNYFSNVNVISLINKSKHKLQCAKKISDTLDINKLLEITVIRIKDSNKIYFDYPFFKTFANPANYDTIVEYILNLFTESINQHGEFEMHVNLKTFSVSAAERYKNCIESFIKKCISKNTPFVKTTKCIYIYNTPSVIDSISRIINHFIEPEIKEKMVFYDKSNSDKLIEKLFEPSAK